VRLCEQLLQLGDNAALLGKRRKRKWKLPERVESDPRQLNTARVMVSELNDFPAVEEVEEIFAIKMLKAREDKNVRGANSSECGAADLVQVRSELAIQYVTGPENGLGTPYLCAGPVTEDPCGFGFNMLQAKVGDW
jgi:hypothetical protein